ncbi:hypothetical protein, partial [Eggerthella lenta]|uniref:hypothetical protein n=1 Tax=Eggerthella lenta TaxID=84112 RepID=UPI001D095A99
STSANYLGNLSQLTLFPSVSKTGKTDLGSVRSIPRKHFLQESTLLQFQVIELTLVKGDEVVEVAEEGAD